MVVDTLVRRVRKFMEDPGAKLYVFEYAPFEYHEFVDNLDDNLDVYTNVVRPRNSVKLHGLLVIKGIRATVVVRGNLTAMVRSVNPLMAQLTKEFPKIVQWGFGC
jgi:hypothetical protein